MKDYSKIKLVVADMDGTLLNSEHQVSEQFFELYSRLKEQGVLFAAASGRQFDSIVDKLQPIAKDIIVIAEKRWICSSPGTGVREQSTTQST